MSFIQNFKEWSSSSSSFLFLECVWLTEKVLNPDKSDYTNFIFTSETQSRQKQTNKQTKQKQNRSNIQQMNSMWPCGHVSVKDLRSLQAVENGTRRAAECVTDALTTFKVFWNPLANKRTTTTNRLDLTLYTLTSESTFSILFSLCFL